MPEQTINILHGHKLTIKRSPTPEGGVYVDDGEIFLHAENSGSIPVTVWEPPLASDKWTVAFYNGADLSGTPVFTELRTSLDLSFGSLAPGSLSGKPFSLRAERIFETGGEYTFTATADDGVRIKKNDEDWFMDEWRPQSATTFTEEVTLADDDVITVEYYDNGPAGVGRIKVEWEMDAVEPPPPPPPPPPQFHWAIDWYQSAEPTGTIVHQSIHPELKFKWAAGELPPIITGKPFSFRARRTFAQDVGLYRLSARVDDGVRVKIDDGPWLINEWRPQSATTFTKDVTISTSSPQLTVEYYDNGPAGTGEIEFTMVKVTNTPPPNPDQPPPPPPPPDPVRTPSGIPMPSSPPSGWVRKVTEHFDQDIPLGKWGQTDGFPTPGNRWRPRPDAARDGTYRDSSGRGIYNARKTTSQHDSMLDIWIHSEGNNRYVSAPLTLWGDSYTQRIDTVMRVTDAMGGYKCAWLLWPESGANENGEIDFPEGKFDGGSGNAFHHWARPQKGQEGWSLSKYNNRFQRWARYTLEFWAKGHNGNGTGYVKFWWNGQLVGQSTTFVSPMRMHFVMQNETYLKGQPLPAPTSGHVLVDWFTLDVHSSDPRA